MKILVTGTSGKLVTYLRNYVQENKKDWTFEFVSLRNDGWKEKPLTEYDSILHCAGITSAPENNYEDFYRINVKLTKELFEECVRQKARHFVYLSSMAVYDGTAWGFGEDGLIREDTLPVQKSNYGKSKYLAEEAIRSVDPGETKVAIVRAPSIVGGGLEAYFRIYILYSRIPLVPVPWIHTEAKRSFIYVDTLIDQLCDIAGSAEEGIFFPQSFPQLSVSEMIDEICKAKGIRKHRSKLLGKMIPASIIRRRFSQICYDPSLRGGAGPDAVTTREAIRRSLEEPAVSSGGKKG